jgi:hypothetical protein
LTGTDLEEALIFHKKYAEAICDALEIRFADNDVISAFKVLSPCNMPTRHVGLSSWGVVDLEKLCEHYGQNREFNGKVLPTFIYVTATKREFYTFKLQATIEWMDKSFFDLWSHISWSPTLQVKFLNLLILSKIARVQYVSIASCKRAFSVQNAIKTKFRNTLKTKNLESVLCMALEGPKDNVEAILIEAISL